MNRGSSCGPDSPGIRLSVASVSPHDQDFTVGQAQGRVSGGVAGRVDDAGTARHVQDFFVGETRRLGHGLRSGHAIAQEVGQPTSEPGLAARIVISQEQVVDVVAVCLGTFMLLLDVTIVNVALPDIQPALHSSFSDLQWVVDAYALTLAALLLTAGGLADMYGSRLLYLIGLAVFTAASVLCGLPPAR